MNRSWIVAAIMLAALGWAVWEIYSLRRSNALLAEGIRTERLRSPSLAVASPGSPSALTAPGTDARSASSLTGPQPAGRPAREGTVSIDDLIGGLAPEVLPDGTVVIGKGTRREVAMTAGEAAELSAALTKATEDARNKGPNGASYSAGKATGPPDGPNHGGDSTSAWCPAPASGTGEWLQLKYAKNVEISEVNIHETYATGALAKVTAVMPNGSEKTLWEGTEPVEPPPVERVLKVPPGIRADQLRITLDNSRTGTWQEIDAVEIVGNDGSRQWATEATASSHWGSGSGEGTGFGTRRLEERGLTTWGAGNLQTLR
jgi:hypothetical protein